MINFKAQRVLSNRWIYGNLVLDKNDVSYIVPTNSVEFKNDKLIISSPKLIKQSTICQYVFTFKNKRFYEDDIIKISVVDGDSFIGRIENDKGTWKVYDRLSQGLGVSVLFSDEVVDIEKLGNYHTHKDKWNNDKFK